MKQSMAVMALLLVLAIPAQSNMIMEEGGERLKVFYSMTDRVGWNAVLKGKIISYASKDEYDPGDLFGRAQDNSKATVRLYNADGINEGDTLYVINDSNLIVAKIKVRAIFKSASLGEMLVGYGNFRLSSVGDRVIQKSEDENSKFSYIYKARGDYYENTGNKGEAIREYENALKLDKNNPNAHLALGLVYLKQGLDQFALREFQEGYKNIGRLYDNEDKFLLLRSIADIRFREVYESFAPERQKEQFREEGIKICREALQVYPQSERMNYYLGVFYYRTPKPDDKKARDYLLRVLDLNPSNSDACVALSELYYRHENMAKARLYAQKALDADRANPRAQRMLKYIESKEQVK
jgi:tetratricopeptide (TPR) repeat protein